MNREPGYPVFQLLKQYLLIISAKGLSLPVNQHRGVRLLLGDGIIRFRCAVRSGGAGCQNLYLIADANNATVACDKILAEIDIAIIYRSTEGLQCCERFAGWMFLAFSGLTVVKIQRLQGFATSK